MKNAYNGIDLGPGEALDDPGPRYYFLNGEAMRYALEKMQAECGPNETVDVDACEFWRHMFGWAAPRKLEDRA